MPEPYAPIHTFLAAVKGKYKLPILISLKHGPKRYSQLHRRLAGASERMLARQLGELVRDGILSRSVTGEKPPLRVEYALTTHGLTLCAVVRQMWEWGEQAPEKSAAKN